MKTYSILSTLLLLGGLVAPATSQIIITQDDIDENGRIILQIEQVECPVVPIEPVEPIDPPSDGFRAQVVYEEDISENRKPQSTPERLSLPTGLDKEFNVEYIGAQLFPFSYHFGSNHAVGVITYNDKNNSIFMAGHDHKDTIAEFRLSEFTKSNKLKELNTAETIQKYVEVLGDSRNDKITGLHVIGEQLFVTSERWYDGEPDEVKHSLQVLNTDDLANSDLSFYGVEHFERAAGYMFDIPEDAQPLLGSRYAMGNASNYSITSRYSQGPSLYTFAPSDIKNRILKNQKWLNYPFCYGCEKQLTPDSDENENFNPSIMWNTLSKARYAFIVPNSNILMVVGASGGFHSGIIYKEHPDYPGITGPGSLAIDSKDYYNFYWLYDLNAIADAAKRNKPWDVKPFNYGKWSHPFDKGNGDVLGGSYDIQTQTLYLTLRGKGKIDRYDYAPLLIAYRIAHKE